MSKQEQTQITGTGSQRSSLALSQKQEIRLMKYVDGECGVVGSFFVQRFLERNEAAKAFVEALQKNSLVLKERESLDAPDLWGRIERRIEQEERNAVFLGERAFRSSNSPFAKSIYEKFFDWQPAGIIGGLSGGAIAALAVLAVWQGGSDGSAGSKFNDAAPMVANHQAGVPRVGLVSGRTGDNDSGRFIGERYPVEVDWIRSDGRVRMIPDSRAPIIWVRRTRKGGMLVNRRVVPRIPAVQERYGSEGLSDSVVMQESPLPTGNRSE